MVYISRGTNAANKRSNSSISGESSPQALKMSKTMMDISEVHSLGCTSTKSEDSSLRTSNSLPTGLDKYETPTKWHQTKSNLGYDAKKRLKFLKSQPPGGHNPA